MEQKIGVTKHIKLFEEYNNEDYFIFINIYGYSKDKWFIEGNDPPSDVISDLEDAVSSNSDLEELIELTRTGPGFTDVWLIRNELISDAIRDGYSIDAIDSSNQEYFAEHRKELIDKLSLKYPPLNWQKIK